MMTVELIDTAGLLVVIGFLAYVVSIHNTVQRLLNITPKVASNIAVLVRKRMDVRRSSERTSQGRPASSDDTPCGGKFSRRPTVMGIFKIGCLGRYLEAKSGAGEECYLDAVKQAISTLWVLFIAESRRC